MKTIKYAAGALTLALALTSVQASAESCEWKTSSVSASGDPVNITFSCASKGRTLALKSVSQPIKGNPTCKVFIVDRSYINIGTCAFPNIVPARAGFGAEVLESEAKNVTK